MGPDLPLCFGPTNKTNKCHFGVKPCADATMQKLIQANGGYEIKE